MVLSREAMIQIRTYLDLALKVGHFVRKMLDFIITLRKTTISDSYISNITSETSGFYYDYNNYVYRDDYVVKVAIDFDAGYIWFGGWNGSLERWKVIPQQGRIQITLYTKHTAVSGSRV